MHCVNSPAANGLTMKSFMPAAIALCRSLPSAPAVSAMIGNVASRASPRMRRVASIPSSTGICTSISTTSNACGAAHKVSNACRPLLAVPTCAPCNSRMRLATSTLIWLSSTTSTRTPASAAAPGTASKAPSSSSNAAEAVANGSVTMNSLPTPGSLSTAMRPPINSTRCLTIESPRPVPPKRRVMESSAWTKGLNRPACSSGAMPMPVSRTAKLNVTSPACEAAWPTRSVTDPRSVNLTAFDSRLASTCPRCLTSPSTAAGSSSTISTSKPTPLACAVTPIRSACSRINCCGLKTVRSSRSSPASILERSSTSLMTASNDLLAVVILFTKSACSALSRVCRSR